MQILFPPQQIAICKETELKLIRQYYAHPTLSQGHGGSKTLEGVKEGENKNSWGTEWVALIPSPSWLGDNFSLEGEEGEQLSLKETFPFSSEAPPPSKL